ncbi:hypothetical protein CIHG_05353 [Coccidioides immitis H538.4]|uniref:Uncharacterized protein n=2 Tax=Coccidioides immitis TaxID=5501 RepID=A0A0J8R5X9_COCIT|nr:hypothetical protein CISG_07922 [Coccidioides immitis RMSCC 3703]KMU88182.1 hypothetical protein CIHG_05353 [Coccidioides immitis H538.4]
MDPHPMISPETAEPSPEYHSNAGGQQQLASSGMKWPSISSLIFSFKALPFTAYSSFSLR